MKRTILSLVCMIIMSLSIRTVSAQVQGAEKEKKWEVSSNFIMGGFTDEFIKPVYDNVIGFNVGVTRTVFKDLIGVGIVYKHVGNNNGIPYTYGYTDENASSQIKMNTYSGELNITPFKFLKVYGRYGFLNLKESLQSEIGDKDASENGSSMDVGMRFQINLTSPLRLLVGGEYTTQTLKNVDIDNGSANYFSGNVGLGYVF